MNPSLTFTQVVARSSLQCVARTGNVSKLACCTVRYLHIALPTLAKPPQLTNHFRHASNLTTTRTQQPQQCTTLSNRRLFSTTPSLLKKGGKAARDESKAQASSQKDAAPAEDPNDFSALEADIAAAVERVKDDLSKLRAGGRFNHEVLENLRVQPDKNAGAKVRLSDVAQVVPKGRTVQVLVGEKDVSCFAPIERLSYLALRSAYGKQRF